LEQAIKAFLIDLKLIQGRASNTLAAYRADLEQFQRVVQWETGEVPAAAGLTPEQIDVYVTWLNGQDYRTSTVARKMAAVRSFLKFVGSHEGRGTGTLAGRLSPPTASTSRSTRILTPAEIGALLAAPGDRGRVRDLRDAAILAVLYVTGIKAEQAVSLRTFDIDWEHGVLRVQGEPDLKPLNEAYEPLRVYLQESRPQLLSGPDDGALFLNQRGGGLSRQGLWLVVKKWSTAAGLEGSISPHTLRRTRAEHLLDRGWRKREVQRFLGLTSPNTLRGQPAPNTKREDRNLDE